MNQVAISGTLTRDPEVRTIPSGTTVCTLRIAVNERTKDGDNWTDKPNYFNVTIWKGIGEWVGRTLHKGDEIAVTGRLRWREWEKDGVKREAVDITADSIMPRQRDGNSNTGGSSNNPVRTNQTDIPADDPTPTPVYGDPDDDIPFAHEPDRYEWEPWHAHENR